jgi:hypothetical protein
MQARKQLKDLLDYVPDNINAIYAITVGWDVLNIQVQKRPEPMATRGGPTRGLAVTFDASKNAWTLQLQGGDKFTEMQWGINSLEELFARKSYTQAEHSAVEAAGYGMANQRSVLSWVSGNDKGVIVFSMSHAKPGLLLFCDTVQILDGVFSTGSSNAFTGGITLRKPIIYAYAPENTQVSIGFGGDVAERLIEEIPKRSPDGKWNFTTGPTGCLKMQDGSEYSSLFWEATRAEPYPFQDNYFYLKGSAFVDHMTNLLPAMGLIEAEASAFIDYWKTFFLAEKFYQIEFIEEEYTREHPLLVEPRPVAMLRIFMIFSEVPEHVFNKFYLTKAFHLGWRRPGPSTGLVIIEWGGAEMGAKLSPPASKVFVVKTLPIPTTDNAWIKRDETLFLDTMERLAPVFRRINDTQPTETRKWSFPSKPMTKAPLKQEQENADVAPNEGSKRNAYIERDERLHVLYSVALYNQLYADLSMGKSTQKNAQTEHTDTPDGTFLARLQRPNNRSFSTRKTTNLNEILRKVVREHLEFIEQALPKRPTDQPPMRVTALIEERSYLLRVLFQTHHLMNVPLFKPFKSQLSKWVYRGPIKVTRAPTKFYGCTNKRPKLITWSSPDYVNYFAEVVAGLGEIPIIHMEVTCRVDDPSSTSYNIRYIRRIVVC